MWKNSISRGELEEVIETRDGLSPLPMRDAIVTGKAESHSGFDLREARPLAELAKSIWKVVHAISIAEQDLTEKDADLAGSD